MTPRSSRNCGTRCLARDLPRFSRDGSIGEAQSTESASELLQIVLPWFPGGMHTPRDSDHNPSGSGV